MEKLNLEAFSSITKDQWEVLAAKQLKGANPKEHLSWENDAEISLDGYYDSSDLSELNYLSDFFSTLPPHRWKLYESIPKMEITKSNTSAIKALMGGCDGIIFEDFSYENLDSVLKDINPEICDICIITNDNTEPPKEIFGFISAPGGNCIASYESQNPIAQLKSILSEISNEKFIRRIAFKDFFLEIASVRALRFLLATKDIKEVHIHTKVPAHEHTDHQWFLNTSSALASILGGSHSIDLTTAIGDSRISRNTGNLIREESGINEYTDQCGGSYYIEVLTHKIIQEVKASLV